ncbi:MAG: serine hydrolase domain-containing protein [Bacteroidota bacterium]
MKSNIIILLFLLSASSCIVDENIKLDNNDYLPAELNDGWDISTPEAEQASTDAVHSLYKKFYSENDYVTAISLLIAKNGKIIGEGYCRDKTDRDVYHQTQSVTKSITSLVFGIACDKGYFPNLDTSIAIYFPNYIDATNPRKGITIKHLLTMKSGLDFENSKDSEQLINYEENSVAFTLQKDLLYTPGTIFKYHDGCPQLISAMITKETGMSMAKFADTYLFEPLGITNYRWDNHKDGVTYGANNLWLTPRDMLKIGQLCTNYGTWDGKRIVSEDWITKSTQIYATPTLIGPYGYYWWIRPDNNAFTASGVGGQHIYIVPKQDLVLVFTAEPYASDLISTLQWDLESEIIPLME